MQREGRKNREHLHDVGGIPEYKELLEPLNLFQQHFNDA